MSYFLELVIVVILRDRNLKITSRMVRANARIMTYKTAKDLMSPSNNPHLRK
jgi:hypothetical protein